MQSYPSPTTSQNIHLRETCWPQDNFLSHPQTSLIVCITGSYVMMFTLQASHLIFLLDLIWLQEKQRSLNISEWQKEENRAFPSIEETLCEELEGPWEMFYLNFSFYCCGTWRPEKATHLLSVLPLISYLFCLPFSLPLSPNSTHKSLKLFCLKSYLDK